MDCNLSVGKTITLDGTDDDEGTVEINGTGVFTLQAGGTPDMDSGLFLYSSETATTKIIHTFGFYDVAVTANSWTCPDTVQIAHNAMLSDASVIWKGDVTVGNDVSVTNSTVTYEKSLTAAHDILLTDSNGTFTGAVEATAGDITLTSSEGDFGSSVTAGRDLVATTVHSNFSGAVTAANDITLADSETTFADAVQATAGNLTLTNGTAEFSSAVTVGGALSVAGTTASFNNGAGDSVLSAKTCSLASGTVSLGNTAGDSFTVTDGELRFPAALTTVRTAGTITARSGIVSEKDIALNADTAFASPFTLATDVVTVFNATATGNATLTFNATVNGAHTLALDCNATFNAPFASDEYAVTAVRAIGTDARTWSGTNGIVLPATDVFIDAVDGAGANTALTVASDLTCKNLYFFRGNLLAQSRTLATSGDVAVWGAGYNPDDPRFSGADTRFAYFIAEAGLSYYPAGGTEIANTSAVFSTIADATISVGGNFYDNGADMAGSFCPIMRLQILSLTMGLP